MATVGACWCSWAVAAMRRLFSQLIFLALVTVSTAAPAGAEKRIALVIGNSTYKHAGVLTNPKNDATDMSAALKKVGFQVIDGFDLDKTSFDRKIREFANTLSGADAGLFFYAGHGLQVSGQNYLVPIDAELATAASLEFEMVRLDVVHRIMEQAAPTNILFLDACRNNPLARNLARVLGTRSAEIGRGLAAVESGSGTLISFSTQPGNVALDGSGRNSPFAAALSKQISSSSDDLSALLIAVRNEVMNVTQRKQVPWEHSALTGRFYFSAPRQPPAALTPPTPAWRLSEAAEAWDRTKETTNVAALELFVGRYKDTYYADLARLRIVELKSIVTVPSPPPRPAQADRDFELGERYLYGRGVPRDYGKARELYEKAAAAGHGGGLNALGSLYRNGWSVPQDYAKARQLYEESAAKGHGYAMSNLGFLYREGFGVPPDYSKAREWSEKSAAVGNPAGFSELGVLYERGHGVPQDFAKARDLYQKAAAGGNGYGMNNLGRLYQSGRRGPQDYTKAREWYEKAAAQGNRYAKANLASLPQAIGGPVDDARAAKVVLELAKANDDEIIGDLRGDMRQWAQSIRTEIKRELTRLGHYSGPIDDKWDDITRAAVSKYLGRSK